VPEISVLALHTVRLAFARGDVMVPGIIDEAVIQGKRIGILL